MIEALNIHAKPIVGLSPFAHRTLSSTDEPIPVAKEFNFLRGVLPAGLTYTNSSTTRTYFGSDGLLKTAAANEPIFEYDPLTLTLRGMRLEMEQRTNSVLYSSEDNATWIDVSTSHIATGNPLIQGKMPTRITAAAGTGRLQQVLTTFTGSAECVWAIVEQGTAISTRVRLWDHTASVAVADCLITWSSEAISGTGAFGGRKLKATGPNGGKLFLLWASASGTSGNSKRYYLYPDVGGGAGTCYLHHAQLEAGSYPSSIIVTEAAAVIRQPDVLTASSISPWYNQSEGTVVFEGSCSDFSVNRGAYVFHNGTAAERITARVTGTTGAVNTFTVAGSTTQASIVPANADLGVVFRSVIGYKLNNTSAALNGTLGTTDTTCAAPSINALTFGDERHSGNYAPFMGYARRFSYYKTRLPNSQIQGLSRV